MHPFPLSTALNENGEKVVRTALHAVFSAWQQEESAKILLSMLQCPLQHIVQQGWLRSNSHNFKIKFLWVKSNFKYLNNPAYRNTGSWTALFFFLVHIDSTHTLITSLSHPILISSTSYVSKVKVRAQIQACFLIKMKISQHCRL